MGRCRLPSKLGFQSVGQDFLKDTGREMWIGYNCLPDPGLDDRHIKMHKHSCCPQGALNSVDFYLD